ASAETKSRIVTRSEEILHEPANLGRGVALGRASAQLRFGDHADSDVRRAVREQPLQHSSLLLERVDARVGIEQELHRMRARLSTLLCAGRARSSGTPANDST